VIASFPFYGHVFLSSLFINPHSWIPRVLLYALQFNIPISLDRTNVLGSSALGLDIHYVQVRNFLSATSGLGLIDLREGDRQHVETK